MEIGIHLVILANKQWIVLLKQGFCFRQPAGNRFKFDVEMRHAPKVSSNCADCFPVCPKEFFLKRILTSHDFNGQVVKHLQAIIVYFPGNRDCFFKHMANATVFLL